MRNYICFKYPLFSQGRFGVILIPFKVNDIFPAYANHLIYGVIYLGRMDIHKDSQGNTDIKRFILKRDKAGISPGCWHINLRDIYFTVHQLRKTEIKPSNPYIRKLLLYPLYIPSEAAACLKKTLELQVQEFLDKHILEKYLVFIMP